MTPVVCCAVANVAVLTSNLVHKSFSAEMCSHRCGPTCVGTGSTPTSPCVSCSRPVVCGGSGVVRLSNWRFRNVSLDCDRWQCHLPESHASFSHSDELVIGPDAVVSVRSGKTIVGSGGSRLDLGHKPLVLHHPATLRSVTFVNAPPSGCAVELRLPSHHHATSPSVFEDVGRSDSGCALLVTGRSRSLFGVGDVKVKLSSGTTYEWGVVLRSIKGTVTMESDGQVLLYEHEPGHTRIVSRTANIYNLSSALSLFSPEYLIDYFHGHAHRGIPVPSFIANYAIHSAVVAVLLTAAAVVSQD